MTDQSLLNYVQQGRTAGMSDEDIRKELTGAGWAPDAVTSALGSQQSATEHGGSLNAEQTQYINKWSWGGFFLTWIYFFASRHGKNGILFLLGSFVPVLNVVLVFVAAIKGRRMAWESGKWESFESYEQRQRLLNKIGWIVAILFAIGFVALVATLTLLNLGEMRQAVPSSNVPSL